MRLADRLLLLLRQILEQKMVRKWFPEPFYLVAVSLIMAGVWVFFELADVVMEGESHALDRMILLALRTPGNPNDPLGPPWVEEMVRDFTSFGSVPVLTFALLAAAGYLFLQGKHRSMLLMVAAIAGGTLLSLLLKHAFDRPRPDLVAPLAHTLTASFPSGHALLAATTYLSMGALLARVQPQRSLKIYLMCLAILLTLIVGFTRVYLGVHWPTDVLAGWTLGGVWGLTCWLVAQLLQRRGKMDREE